MCAPDRGDCSSNVPSGPGNRQVRHISCKETMRLSNQLPLGNGGQLQLLVDVGRGYQMKVCVYLTATVRLSVSGKAGSCPSRFVFSPSLNTNQRSLPSRML